MEDSSQSTDIASEMTTRLRDIGYNPEMQIKAQQYAHP